ncbi:MAG: hypothetical protein KAJ19_12085, partial [Gammaproteobacteria bacterium]|nr:hypothetical protein [Gammaproteobacteria bacterium]
PAVLNFGRDNVSYIRSGTAVGYMCFITNGLAAAVANASLVLTANRKVVVNTGLTGTSYDLSGQTSGTWEFSNNSGGATYPTLSAKTTGSTTAMSFIAGTSDANTAGDMNFAVRESDNTDFATFTSTAFKWVRMSTVLMTLLRDGRLGIGTTDPNSNGGAGSGVLHINSGNDWSITHYTNPTTGTAAADGSIIGMIGSTAYFWNYEAGSLYLGTSGNTRMTIDSAGNVGVGTTSPDALFNIESEAPQMLFTETSGTTNEKNLRIMLNGGLASFQGRNDTNTGAGSAGDMMTFDMTNGYCGIGTTAPGYNLHILDNTGAELRLTSTADAGITLQADTDNVTESHNPYIKFLQDASGIQGTIGMTQTGFDAVGNVVTGGLDNALMLNTIHASYPMQFAVNGAVRMTIEPSGQVGINQTVPTYTLDVTGDGRFTSEVTINTHSFLRSTARTSLISLEYSGSGYNGIMIEADTDAKWSVMGQQGNFGLYDDQNGKWIINYQENSRIDFYHDGTARAQTTDRGMAMGLVSSDAFDTYPERKRVLKLTNVVTYGTGQVGLQ